MNISINRRTSLAFLIIAALLWSTSGILIRVLDWQPAAILAGRSIFSGLLFMVYLRRFPRKWTRWQLLAASGYILTQFLYITSVKLTTVANAIFLQYTAPIYIIFLGYWLLKEKPTRADWVSMVVIFTGLLLFFGDGLSLDGLYGNILAAFSGVTMALMMIAMRAQKNANPAESILLANLFTATLGFPFVLNAHWTVLNWVIVIYLGVFQIGLGFLLYSIAIKHVPALEATLLGTMEPILSPLWVFIFLGERPGNIAFLGALIVLAGVVFNAVANPNVET
jgi:drug/metabolite transporter (DMT)-like permease